MVNLHPDPRVLNHIQIIHQEQCLNYPRDGEYGIIIVCTTIIGVIYITFWTTLVSHLYVDIEAVGRYKWAMAFLKRNFNSTTVILSLILPTFSIVDTSFNNAALARYICNPASFSRSAKTFTVSHMLSNVYLVLASLVTDFVSDYASDYFRPPFLARLIRETVLWLWEFFFVLMALEYAACQVWECAKAAQWRQQFQAMRLQRDNSET
jgi:hypothetical protein